MYVFTVTNQKDMTHPTWGEALKSSVRLATELKDAVVWLFAIALAWVFIC